MRAQEQIYSGFSLDWLVAGTLILAGSIALYVAYDPSVWNSFVPQASETPPVGVAGKVNGDVRYRLSGSSVWQDLDGNVPAREGDVIMTSDGSEGVLVLDGGTTLEIGPDSMVVVQVEKTEAPKDANPWDTFVGAATTPKSKNAVLEVKKGTVKVGVSSGSTAVKLKAQGKTFEVGSTSQRAGRTDELQLAIDPNGGLKLKSSDPSRLNLSGMEASVETAAAEDLGVRGGAASKAADSMRRLVPPTPSAPANEMTFNVEYQGKQKVFFRWEGAPVGSRPELQVWRTNGDQPMIQTFGTLGGASVDLPDGEYFWLVRVRDEKGMRSDWSPRTFLTVVEADPPPPEVMDGVAGAGGAGAGGAGGLAGGLGVPGDGGLAGGVDGGAARELAAADSAPVDDFAELAKLRERVGDSPLSDDPDEAIRKKEEAEAKRAEMAKQQKAAEARRRAEQLQRQQEAVERARLAAQRQKAIEEARTLQAEMSKLKIVLKKASVASDFGGGGGADALAGMLEDGLKEENMNLNELKVKLAWEEIPDVEKYSLTVLEGGTVFQQTETFEPEYEFTLQSLDHGSFFYTVEATLPSGQTIRSEATPIEVGVGAPIPNIPKNAAEFNTGAEVLMTWAKTTLTKSYKFQIAKDEGFESVVLSKDLPENFISYFPKEPGRYFWRVRSVTAKGETDWSFVKYFEVK